VLGPNGTTADCADRAALAAGGTVVVSGLANRLGKSAVIDEPVAPAKLDSGLLVLPVPLIVADDEAPGL